MSKPRIIISSTCYDLNDARAALTSFLENHGFEVLNSQLPNFGVDPTLHSHTACIEAVKQSDYLILIIGGRYGGTYIGSTKSITNEEYRQAVKMDIPILIFVDERVENAIGIWKKNPTSNFSAVVDNNKIFDFVEYIRASSSNNWIFKYKNVQEIIEALRAQFAHYLWLFSQRQVKGTQVVKTDGSSKLPYVEFPHNLQGLSIKRLSQDEETGLLYGLKDLNGVMSKILLSEGKDDFKREKLKVLWVVAKYGELNFDGSGFIVDADIYREYTWGTFKGKRVFQQFEPYGVNAYYDFDDDINKVDVRLSFKNESQDVNTAHALMVYVKDLTDKFGDEVAYDTFLKADMRIYTELDEKPTKAKASSETPRRVIDIKKAMKRNK